MAKHLKEVTTGGNWTWSNIQDVLSNVDVELANKKKSNTNSIIALTYHIHYYVDAILCVYENKPFVSKDEFSYQHPIIVGEDEWLKFKESIIADFLRLAKFVEVTPENKWFETFVDVKYGNYFRNIMGLIEHTHYHLGQIAILKKTE